MRISKNIDFLNFKKKFNTKNIKSNFNKIISERNEVIESLKSSYKYSFSKKIIKKYKSIDSIQIIGMGGSILGSKAIFSFLYNKIKKKIFFIDNLIPLRKKDKLSKNLLNIVISKSGNTIETASNSNILIGNNKKNIFITENTNNYLRKIANKIKAEIIDHNNFIGGRYSVLSEVGMLPASLMGLNEKKFKKFDELIKNKKFVNSLILNVQNIYDLMKNKKYNSIILNYDKNSEDLFKWYQQLVAESLGKKQKGILPIISTMPKDNHSVMQLYLDGKKNNFFTFFSVKSINSNKIRSNISDKFYFLKNKKILEIIDSQRLATQKVFIEKKIPFRSFSIKNRNEDVLGELFSFYFRNNYVGKTA